MNIVKLQNIKLTHRNPLHSDTLMMRNAGLDEAQAGIKIAGKISITSDMQITSPLWQNVKN